MAIAHVSSFQRQSPDAIPASLEPLAIRLPYGLAELFGYPGHARFVAFYWEQVGDEVTFDDGQSAGTAEWYPFKCFIEHRRVAPLLVRYDFGSSDAAAQHWLVIDRAVGQAYAASAVACRAFLSGQPAAHPTISADQLASIGEKIRRLATQLPDEAHRRAIEVFAAKQRLHVERLVRFLDRLPPPRR